MAKAKSKKAASKKSVPRKPASKKAAPKKAAPKKAAPKKQSARKPAAPKQPARKQPAKPVAAPRRANAEFPYVHVGHGISAARKSWSFAIVLEAPGDAAAIEALARPEPLDELAVQGHTIEVGHGADSLQWVVAAVYDGGGTRADHGEATQAQWAAFNTAIDTWLAAIHALSPIAIVVRTIDDEYSTETSLWHDWSCRALPAVLPFLASATSEWYLGHAIDLWHGWLDTLPIAEQKALVAALPADAKAVLKRHGGVPKPTEPKRKSDPMPTLDEMKAAWAALDPQRDPIEAFAAAFGHLWFESGGKVELLNLLHALKKPADDALLVDVVRRALASPNVQWPDTHWRPDLVDALVRLGRFDEAQLEVARVMLGAASYLSGSWETLIHYLDASERQDAGDLMYRIADRYVTGFEMARKRAKGVRLDLNAAAQLVLELSAPLRDRLDLLGVEQLSHAAFLLEDLVEDGGASADLHPEAARIRALYQARRAAVFTDGLARLARGERLATKELAALLKESWSYAKTLGVDDARNLVAATRTEPELFASLTALAYYAKDDNVPVAVAVYRGMLTSEPPQVADARTAWLQAANNALIVTHAAKQFAESAELADVVVKYVRENPFITHAAACSYAAVGRYDDAFAQARLAVELAYPHLDRLAIDTDLGPLLERADFKALF